MTRDQGLVTITVAGRVAIQFWTRVEADAVAIVDAFTRVTPDPLRAAWARGRNAVLDAVANGDLEYSHVDMGWRGDLPEYQP